MITVKGNNIQNSTTQNLLPKEACKEAAIEQVKAGVGETNKVPIEGMSNSRTLLLAYSQSAMAS